MTRKIEQKQAQETKEFDFKQALEDLKQNEVFAGIYKEIEANSTEYIVDKWDTIFSIAKKLWMSSYEDLLYFNTVLGNTISTIGSKRTKILIKPWDKVFVPKDLEKFKEHFSIIKKTHDNIELNQNVIEKDISALKNYLESWLFNKRVQSLWLPNLLDWFIWSQLNLLDPKLPRIVDSSREDHVTCANLIRRLMWAAVNPWDLTPQEKAFLLKQNVHAWILPTELMKIWFQQKFWNLMDSFDRWSLWATDPIDTAKRSAYDKAVVDLWKYMKEKWNDIKWSLVPYYFTFSRYRWVVANYNSWRKEDYHLNTHQSMLAWNADMKFKAQEVWQVKNGKVESFFDDKEPMKKQLAELNSRLVEEKTHLEDSKDKLLKTLKLENNKELEKNIERLDRALMREAKWDQEKYNQFMALVETLDPEKVRLWMSKILKYKVTTDYANTVVNYQRSKKKALWDIDAINTMLWQGNQLVKINAKDFWFTVWRNPSVVRWLQDYNKTLDWIEDVENKIKQLKEDIVKIEEQKKQREIEKQKAKEDNVKLTEQLNLQKVQLQKSRESLLTSIDPEKNAEVKRKLTVVDRKLDTILKSVKSDEKKQELKTEIFEAFEKNSLTKELSDKIKKEARYNLWEQDFSYLRTLFLQRKKLMWNLEDITKVVNQDAPRSLKLEEFNSAFANIPEIVKSVKEYNSIFDTIEGVKSDIAKKTEFVDNFVRDSKDADLQIRQVQEEIKKLTESLFSKNEQLDRAKTSIINALDSSPELKKQLEWPQRKDVEDSIARLKWHLWLKTLATIDSNWLSLAAKNNPKIMEAISKYNLWVEWIRKTQMWISENEEKIRAEKSVSIIDYISSFIQTRADFSPYVFSPWFKQKILEWIEKYSELIDLKVNWKQIDFKEELSKYKNNKESCFKIKTSDEVQISWPIMIDWEHQFNHSDPDRKSKMNSRTRFFFEFVVPGCYLPTELIEVWKDSAFGKRDFWRHINKLPIKWVYDLRRWEKLEDVIRRQFEVQEWLSKPLFEEWMSKEDYEKKLKEYENKFRYYYSKQINGLQLAWFMKNEALLNPWAMKINRPIPYFDVTKVDDVFRDYLSTKKEQFKNDNIEMSGWKDFVDVMLMPWDTYKLIYKRIVEYITPHSNKEKYPNLKHIQHLSELQMIAFMEQFITRSIKSDKSINFADLIDWKFPSQSKLILSLKDIDEIIINIMANVWIKRELDTKQIDNAVINIVVGSYQTEQMLREILHTESKDSDKIIWRKDIKKLFEGTSRITSLWDFQIRINSIRSWFNPEYINKEQLQKALDLVNEDTLNKIDERSTHEWWMITNEVKSQYKKDLLKVNEIKNILKKNPLQKEDFLKIAELLKELMVMDDWTSKNIVWKIIWASLINDKLNLHILKICWNLVATWEKLIDVYKDKDSLECFEKSTLVANNLWDPTAKLAFTQNYVLRILNTWLWMNLKTRSVLYKNPWEEDSFDAHIEDVLRSRWVEIDNVVEKMWRTLLWKIRYNNIIYWVHLEDYAKNAKTKLDNLSPEDRVVAEKVIKFCEGALNWVIWNTEFLADPEVKEFLKRKNLSASMLPTKDEFMSNDFTRTVFNYVNKDDKKKEKEQKKLAENNKKDTSSIYN